MTICLPFVTNDTEFTVSIRTFAGCWNISWKIDLMVSLVMTSFESSPISTTLLVFVAFLLLVIIKIEANGWAIDIKIWLSKLNFVKSISSGQNYTHPQLLRMCKWLILKCDPTLQPIFWHFKTQVRWMIRPWIFPKYVSLTREVDWWRHFKLLMTSSKIDCCLLHTSLMTQLVMSAIVVISQGVSLAHFSNSFHVGSWNTTAAVHPPPRNACCITKKLKFGTILVLFLQRFSSIIT